MVEFVIENLPEELHRALQEYAYKAGSTIEEVARDALIARFEVDDDVEEDYRPKMVVQSQGEGTSSA